MNVKYAKTLLDKWKSTSDIAYNGLEAFEKCKKNKYDVIIMDLRMPIMNGYESSRKIRNNGLNKTSLIIGLSASALGNLRQASIDAGTNYYMHKPYKPNQLNRRRAPASKPIWPLPTCTSKWRLSPQAGKGQYASILFHDCFPSTVDGRKKHRHR